MHSRRAEIQLPSVFLLPPNRVWRTYLGGRVLDALEGKQNPADGHYPEDWIASTTTAENGGGEPEEGLSRVVLGDRIVLLIDLFIQFPEETLGKEHARKYGAHTQFLVKFLDSAVRLPVQCHPTVEFAKRYLNSSSGKTEVYYILKIREEVEHPYVYLGFQHPSGITEFRKAVIEQNIEAILSCFEKIEVRVGDALVVPGGLPHAIGEGIFMIEVMEPTDFAVRIEFERDGFVVPENARFMGRGIDFGLSMFNFGQVSTNEIRKRFFLKPILIRRYSANILEYSLSHDEITRCFRVKKLHLTGDLEKEEPSFYVGIVMKGAGALSSDGMRYPLKPGDTFFVPFKTERVHFTSPQGMEILFVFPPDF